MKRILSKIESVENCTHHVNEARRGMTTWNIKVDNEAKQDAADVMMFLSTEMG